MNNALNTFYVGSEDRQIADLYYVKEENLFKRKQVNEAVHVVGIDEVGCGSLAGSITTTAVILPEDIKTHIPELPIDSKRLNEVQIRELAATIRTHALMVHLVYTGPQGVNKKGVQKATHYNLKKVVQFVRSQLPNIRIQVDGNKGIKKQKLELIPQGDSKEAAISAAAILAKDFYNRQMACLHTDYPTYGFNHHKGYATPAHQLAIKQYGLTPYHRTHVSETMKKRKQKNDTADLSIDTIKRYLAMTQHIMHQDTHIGNDWERRFISESIERMRKELPFSPKMQFYIEKTYKTIMKKAKDLVLQEEAVLQAYFPSEEDQAPTVSFEAVCGMLSNMMSRLKENPTLINEHDRAFLLDALQILRTKQPLQAHQIHTLCALHDKVTRKQAKTA